MQQEIIGKYQTGGALFISFLVFRYQSSPNNFCIQKTAFLFIIYFR